MSENEKPKQLTLIMVTITYIWDGRAHSETFLADEPPVQALIRMVDAQFKGYRVSLVNTTPVSLEEAALLLNTPELMREEFGTQLLASETKRLLREAKHAVKKGRLQA